MSVDNTFKPEILREVAGPSLDGTQMAVELLTADPADLATHFPRVWINITTGVLKFCLNGTTVKTVTAT